MAGVFELIKGSQRQLVGRHGAVSRADSKALELQAAMEILAEVFRVRLSEVDEMIQGRLEEPTWQSNETRDRWPEMLWIEP
jgi:hypothetical protein